MLRNLLICMIVLLTAPLNAGEQAESTFKSKFEKQNTDIARLYKSFKYQFIWLEKGKWNTRALNLLKAIEKADEEGLNTQEYYRLGELMKKAPEGEEAQVKADQNVTNILLSYTYDLFKGRLRHLKVVSVSLGQSENFDVPDYLMEHFKEDKEGGFLPKMTIPLEAYQRLKTLLAKYREATQNEEWPNFPKGETLKVILASSKSIPKNLKKLSPAEERVLILRKILEAQGDLKETSQNPLYDEKLSKAVQKFQKRHNIEADGIVGPATASLLNLSHKDRMDRLLLAMERWRWLPKKMEGRFLIVNIPQFQLTTYEEGKKKFDMNIIVGRQYRKTPTFSSEIYEVRFNPSWHVPSGIFRKDKLPKIMEDPSYISRKGFVVYDAYSGKRRDPNSIAWGSEDVKLVQPPGSKNALGKIRFTLKTTNDVYLHGTPEQELFKKTKRSFSSGCIRVEDPVKLAFYMFNNEESWPLTKIQAEASKTTTKNVALENPVLIHIIYLTVSVDEEGKAYFFEDIYGRDRVLVEQLKQIHYPGYIAQVDISEYDKEEPEEDSAVLVETEALRPTSGLKESLAEEKSLSSAETTDSPPYPAVRSYGIYH